jgi:hypothetical protein
VPEIGRRFEVSPLGFVSGGDGVADVATKWFAVRIVRRAFFSAVEFGDGGVEALEEGAQVCGGQVVGRAEGAGHERIIAANESRLESAKTMCERYTLKNSQIDEERSDNGSGNCLNAYGA